ncbi:MAG TPA: hypothetical protein VKQ72_04070, partial [Aggregatilineales bacterium]|nr:hypothetical protein [Aggregatilineales bacterium]
MRKALEEKGLPISGCSVGNPETHQTQFGATFFPCEGKYVRVDWRQAPTFEEKEAAKDIVANGCSNNGESLDPIDSNIDSYPPSEPAAKRQLSDVSGFYLYPRVWIGRRPDQAENQIR